jgi:hypothetical protein
MVLAEIGDNLPLPADPDEVKRFEELNEGGPVLSSIHMDWPMKFSSPWNEEAIHILAEGFIASPQAPDLPVLELDPQNMCPSNVQKQCISKLQRTRHEYNRRHSSNAMDTTTIDEEILEKSKTARQDTRRNGVSKYRH